MASPSLRTAVYSPGQIMCFLEQIKGARLPNVGEFFPDLLSFVSFSEDLLNYQEVYRVRKLVLMVKNHLINDDGDGFSFFFRNVVTALFYFLINVWFLTTLILNGAISGFKRATLFKLMESKHIDMLLVQEIHSCFKIK